MKLVPIKKNFKVNTIDEYTQYIKKIVYENYLIDTDKRIVKEFEKEINLTTLEFDLLYMFLNNKNKQYSNKVIIQIHKFNP